MCCTTRRATRTPHRRPGKFATQEEARDAYKRRVAELVEADKRAAQRKVDRFLRGHLAATRRAEGGNGGNERDSGSLGGGVNPVGAGSAAGDEDLSTLRFVNGEVDLDSDCSGDDDNPELVPNNSRELFELAQGNVPWEQLQFPLGTEGKPQGIRLRKASGRWNASITVDREVINLGTWRVRVCACVHVHVRVSMHVRVVEVSPHALSFVSPPRWLSRNAPNDPTPAPSPPTPHLRAAPQAPLTPVKRPRPSVVVRSNWWTSVRRQRTFDAS